MPLVPFVAALKSAFWVALAGTSVTFILIRRRQSRWPVAEVLPQWRAQLRLGSARLFPQ